MTSWQNFIEEHREQYVNELSDFLSVPILSIFLEHLGTYATCFGFCMNDEKFHAPTNFSGSKVLNSDSVPIVKYCNG